VVSYPTQAFNVQVQPGESYLDSDGILQEPMGSVSSVFQILKGGISQRQLNMMTDAATNFYETYIAAGKFLTARPQGDFVHPTQMVKLWYMPSVSRSATFYVKGVYDDGSEASYSTSLSLNTDNLYEFNCNPVDLGLTLEPTGKQMQFFDVWLQNGSLKISDTRRFSFDWDYCERPVFLFFANTFGGVDDVFLRGFIQDGFSTDGTISYQPAQRDDTVFDPTLIVTNKTGQNKWVANSGYKSTSTILYLRDLLVSRQAWYLYYTGSTNLVIPVNIDNADIVLLKRKDNLQAIQVAFSEAHTSKFSFDNRIY
jgi:hypothetical protein